MKARRPAHKFVPLPLPDDPKVNNAADGATNPRSVKVFYTSQDLDGGPISRPVEITYSLQNLNEANHNPHDFGLVKAAYSVKETASILSVGRTTLYGLVTRGALSPVKLGKKTLFVASDLSNFLAK